MHRLAAVATGGAAEMAGFYDYLQDLVGPMGAQVEDLRSKVVREACSTVCAMSTALGDRLQAFGDALMPAFFKVMGASKAALAEPAEGAARHVITSTTLSRCIPELLARCTTAKVRPWDVRACVRACVCVCVCVRVGDGVQAHALFLSSFEGKGAASVGNRVHHQPLPWFRLDGMSLGSTGACALHRVRGADPIDLPNGGA